MKIAFGYKARSGKDTACTFLKGKYGGNIFRIAEPVYDILYYAQQRVGLSPHKDRKFLQIIGTDWGRGLNPDLWINLLIEKMRDSAESHVYVPDLRFYNEFAALKRAGFILVHITRETHEPSTHISECELDTCTEWDYTINNDGTIEDLHAQLLNLATIIR